MKILWWSNAPWAPTGYGCQTREMTAHLQDLGHQVAIQSISGLVGAAITWRGIPIYPTHEHPMGIDIVGAHARKFGADVVISLYDAWALPDNARSSFDPPWIAISPVDSTPASPQLVSRLLSAEYPIALSRHAQRELGISDVTATYIPHGIDIDLFKPGDKAAARAELGFPTDAYLVTMVAANKGYPARKSWPEALMAFKRFRERHPEALLYCHTTKAPFGAGGAGIYFDHLLSALDLPAGAVIFPDPVELSIGIPDEQMALIYQASDVLLNPAMGEGFGLPVVEAQACGCPVVTLDCSAMSELTANGIATTPAMPSWLPQLRVWWQLADVGRVTEALNTIANRSVSQHQDCARRGVSFVRQNFAWPEVMERHWKPFLAQVEAELKLTIGHTHHWSQIGLIRSDGLHAPCLEPNCPAQFIARKNGAGMTLRSGFGNVVDGIELDIQDSPQGGVSKLVMREITDRYGLHTIDFRPGDVVLDIGAHVGIVSIWLARRCPGLRIISVEPLTDNLALLRRNATANGVGDALTIIDAAVTGDGREVLLKGDLEHNSGGASIYHPAAEFAYYASSLTLRELFERFDIQRVKLLKLDCEGAEYEIMRAAAHLLDRVEWLVGEFHNVPGEDPRALRELCLTHLPPEKLRIELDGILC